jgi:hypothetical protein
MDGCWAAWVKSGIWSVRPMAEVESPDEGHPGLDSPLELTGMVCLVCQFHLCLSKHVVNARKGQSPQNPREKCDPFFSKQPFCFAFFTISITSGLTRCDP